METRELLSDIFTLFVHPGTAWKRPSPHTQPIPSRVSMQKGHVLNLFLLMIAPFFLLGACAKTAKGGTPSFQEPVSHAATDAEPGSSLVVYFSRSGEQYGVGKITEGNTAIIAGFIAAHTGADMFEIVPVNDYPYDLQGLFEVAGKEREGNARPDYVGDVENWDKYGTVFIGYPLWFDDMPMIVYHFLEDHDFTGKTIYPFDTSGAEGLLGTVDAIRNKCTGADVRDGLAVRGDTVQTQRRQAEQAVTKWLRESGNLK